MKHILTTTNIISKQSLKRKEGEVMEYNLPEIYQRFSMINRREVLLHNIMRNHYPRTTGTPEKKVSIITPTNKLIYQQNIFSNYAQQLYPQKELIIILNNNQLQLDDWQEVAKSFEHVRIFQIDQDVTLGECLNYAIHQSDGEIVAKLDDDDYYSPNYLPDLVDCFAYTNASIVGKASQFVYFESTGQLMLCHSGAGYQYRNVCGGTFVIKREVLNAIPFQPHNTGEDDRFIQECNQRGLAFYSADPFNYLIYRRTDKTYHTWKINDAEYSSWCTPILTTDDPKPFITV